MTNLPGVYEAKKKDGTQYYRVSITYKNKHISLGSFDTALKAHQCYLLAKEITSSNLSIADYTTSQVITFNKWVILINFRDFGLYFKNPIYLHKKYFVYYISQEEELYFDIEDLFYYSTHKIHKRKGYYFVNDYGMQINILSRYGIKNHSVEGRDYVFADRNNHNFRYDNLEVINPYYGVLKEQKNNKTFYKASININGSYIIGRYKSVNEAAIAYNKAVDFVHNYHICDKDFPTNYIAELTSTAYKDLYTNISISKKILNLFNHEKLNP